MEIKAELIKPYTSDEKNNFIIEYNRQLGYEIIETEEALQAWGYTEEEQTAKRQENFESNFLTTSLGNYRLQPKGYANAQQSIDTVNNMVIYAQGLTEQLAQMIIFYETPDFTKPEECTEEWLVAHQTHPEPMTLQQWGVFYAEFTTLYANKMYRQQLLKGE